MNTDEVLRDLLARALPHVTAKVLRESVADFLVTGSWINPLRGAQFWGEHVNRCVEEVMLQYCRHQSRVSNGSVKSQIYVLDSFNSSIVELEHCIQNHDAL